MPHRLIAFPQSLLERLTNKNYPPTAKRSGEPEDLAHSTCPPSPGLSEMGIHQPRRILEVYANHHDARQEKYELEKYEHEQENLWQVSEQDKRPPLQQQRRQQQQLEEQEEQEEVEDEEESVNPSLNASTTIFNASNPSSVHSSPSSSPSTNTAFSTSDATLPSFPEGPEYKRQVKRAIFDGLTELESKPQKSPTIRQTWARAFHSLVDDHKVAVEAYEEGKDARAPAAETAKRVVEAIKREEKEERQELSKGCACM